jgi:hypothetical protein
MAFPNSAHLPSSSGGSRSVRNGSGPPSCQLAADGEHELEKLQFSLAVALTRGDHHLSTELRERIAALGGDQEEPGT